MENNFQRFLSLVVAVVMVLGMMPMSVFATEGEAAAVAEVNGVQYATLKEAVDAANAAENGATITLLSDITLSQKLTIKKNITIEGKYTITRGIATTILAVDKNATLTLDGGVILDGNNNWTFDSEGYYADMAANLTLSNGAKSSYTTAEEGGIVATAKMITISGSQGAVVMNKATIQNSWTATHNDGALFSVPYGATLTMNEGTEISHIHGSVAGQAGGLWTVNGGVITDTFAHSTNGGLVDLRSNKGQFVINGGDFSYIRTLGLNANGNGILVQVYGEGTKLTINGGYFHDNASFAPGGGWGALVYLNRGGDFEMNGGVMDNTITDKCSTFVANAPTSIVLNGGTMYVDDNLTSYQSLFRGQVTIGKDMVIQAKDDAILYMYYEEGSTLVIDGKILGGIMLINHPNPINNGIVTSDLQISGKVSISQGIWLGDVIVKDGGELTLTGGFYAQDVQEFCAQGYGTILREGVGPEGQDLYEVVPMIIVTFDDQTMDLQDALPEFTYTVSEPIEGDEVMVVVPDPEIEVKKHGEYKITSEAYIFANDKYAIKVIPGKLTVTCNNAVAYNVQDDEYFYDLSEALDAADSGETVQLLKTWEEKLVLVRAGVTFDLNGNVVKTENVLSFGVVMDGKEQVGGIEIDCDTTKAFTKLQPVNGGYLPIYDTAAGMYKFFAFEVQSNKIVPGDNSVTFAMRVVFDNDEAYNVLANTTESCMDFYATMSWTGINGFDIRYKMTDGNVKAYAKAAYNQIQSAGVNNKAMTLKVTGVDKLGAGAYISAAPSVITVAEVTASADALVYNIG